MELDSNKKIANYFFKSPNENENESNKADSTV